MYQRIQSENSFIKYKKNIIPTVILDSLRKNDINCNSIIHSYYCSHGALKTLKREIFTNQNLVSYQKYDVTVLNYLSQSEIIDSEKLSKLLGKSDSLIQKKILEKPERCQNCHNSLRLQIVDNIFEKALVLSCFNSHSPQDRLDFVELQWLQDYIKNLYQLNQFTKNS